MSVTHLHLCKQMQEAMTYLEFSQKQGIGIDALRIRFRNAKKANPAFSRYEFDRNAKMPDEIVSLLSRNAKNETKNINSRPAKVEAKNETKNITSYSVSAAKSAPKIAAKNAAGYILLFSSVVTFASVSLTTMGLVWLVGWFGVAIALAFAAYMVNAVIVARDKNKGDTSFDALNTVIVLELVASMLHFYTFTNILIEKMPDFNIRVFSSIILSLFVGFVSYQSIKIIRNYNAE